MADKNKKNSFILTSVAREIISLCRLVEAYSGSEGRIGVIVGDGGHGKTTCLKEYAATRIQSAVYLQLDAAMSRCSILREICFALGENDKGTSSRLARRIARELRGSRKTLLLDEASTLGSGDCDMLRQIVCCQGGSPLILAGNSSLLQTVNRRDPGFDQFATRLLRVVDLDRLAGKGGGGDLYTAEDVRKLYEYGGIKLTGDAVDLAKKILSVSGSGRLRTVDTVVRCLHISSFIQNSGCINASHIIAAIEQLDLPVIGRLPMAELERMNIDVKQLSKVV